ncbi:hypothetical protein DFH09DRAFT_1319739 [Mycena vulgaris]|nr:hypothetical protein DFH09DRAFT_1319739 [Mycena vulgaris]
MTLSLSASILTVFLIPFVCVYRILRLLLHDFIIMGADDKPLPAIPTPPKPTTAPSPVTLARIPVTPATNLTSPTASNFTTLSTDARAHRGRFIRHILSESECESEGEEGWARALEDALDVLAEAVARGRWLAGARWKRERGRRRARTDTMQSTASDVSEPTAESVGPAADALSQMRELAGQAAPPSSTPGPTHLLLCVAPLDSRIAVVPHEDSGFHLVPQNAGCVFTPGVFAFPEDKDAADDAGLILYGLSEWNTRITTTSAVKLVGGTFTFKGVRSPVQHQALCKALRISIYIHLSLLLEQHFLANSGVRLHFPAPKPRVSAVSYQTPASPPPQPEAPPSSPRRQKPFLPGILSFFSKKHTALYRSHTVTSPGGTSLSASARGGASLDLREITAPVPDDRTRRFSFISADPRPLKPAIPIPTTPDPPSFTTLLARLSAASTLLSSSAGVRFAPPPLIVALAAKEQTVKARGGRLALTGDERAGLASIRGWEARERERDWARGMSGIGGFARMQELSLLVSRHVPAAAGASSFSTASSSASSSASGSPSSSIAIIEPAPPEALAACGRPQWTTYRFYARGGEGEGELDKGLGEAVEGFCSGAGGGCACAGTRLLAANGEAGKEGKGLKEREKDKEGGGCKWREGEHVLRMVHGGIRVDVRVGKDDDAGEKTGKEGKDGDTKADEGEKKADGEEDGEADTGSKLWMWMSCAVCRARTERVAMSDGAYLFSYAKFLELLVYSPAICTLTPGLCAHTAIDPATAAGPAEAPPLPPSRLNIVRHFATRGCTVSFALTAVEGDVYELRVPRVQIAARRGARASMGKEEEAAAAAAASMRSSVAKDDSESVASGSAAKKDGEEEKRALRREIRAWWEGVTDHVDQLGQEQTTPTGLNSKPQFIPTTPQKLGVAGLPPSAPTTPQIARSAQDLSSIDWPLGSHLRQADSLALLTRLREAFHTAEQGLYAQLTQTPAAALNDVRRAFMAAARGAEKRLGAWQRKHLAGPARNKRGVPKLLEVTEPEWWGKGCHTAPGGNIIIRENDWGSIIAFTMSTMDYYRELASMSLVRGSGITSPAATLTPMSTSNPMASSFFSAPANYKLFASAAQAQPDPDREDVVWYEPEAYSAVISRKEHPRDATSLLSLREVLRQKSPIDGGSVLPGSSRFGSLGSAATKASSSVAPPSAWAKPDVQVSRHAAGGEVSGMPEAAESAGKILQEIDAVSSESRPGSALSGSILSGAMFADVHIKRGKASSIVSVESDATVGGKSKEDDADGEAVMHGAVVTEEPESDVRHTESEARHVKAASDALATPTPSSFTNTLTSGLTSAMRYMLSHGEVPRPSMFSKNHHGLLAPADAFAIDERPHIKYDWTIGKRLKFSCTVYYAKQFDNLRKRCGIDDVYLKSLSRSANWAAEGGKSKSNFWKTSDDRFIIKTLVNAWNVADLQVLIELAPSYFRYMDATASKASVLAKLIGFYTIEIRNLETGTVQSKADLLVMENLFYDQKIVKTFDLKAQNVKTLFDGEWIEGQQRTLTLVRPHSKAVLREAIKSDAEFLAKSNIMDYSLLLGVDQERKQIVCGLVDTIGSYTFAKTLEYKAKQGLNSGKDVTVIPPAEYQDRFVSALDGYFLACPDKWSRSMDDNTKHINDPGQLPSIL